MKYVLKIFVLFWLLFGCIGLIISLKHFEIKQNREDSRFLANMCQLVQHRRPFTLTQVSSPRDKSEDITKHASKRSTNSQSYFQVCVKDTIVRIELLLEYGSFSSQQRQIVVSQVSNMKILSKFCANNLKSTLRVEIQGNISRIRD